MSIWVYHLKKMRKKLGVTMLVKEWQTKMQAAVKIEKNRKSHEKVWCEGNEFVSTLKHPGKHYQCTRNDFESSESYTFYMTMLSRQNMVNTIFGWMWQKCHTLANLEWISLCDFYTIFRKCYFEYIILSKTVTKIGGHQVCLEATVQNVSSNHKWEKS